MVNPDLLEFQDLQGLPRKLNKNLLVYPIRMKDALEFYDCVPVLNIEKNNTDDVNILRMSYLKYLVTMFEYYEHYKEQISKEEYKNIMSIREKLIVLMRLVFRVFDIELLIKENGKVSILVDAEFEVSEFDFKKLKTIISEQNMIDIEDENTNPEFRRKLKEAAEFMARRGGKSAPLKQRILAYQYEMKCSIDDVFNCTLFQFNSMLENIAHIKHADTVQLAMYSGMVTMKDGVKAPHWLNAIEKADNPLLMDAEQVKKDTVKNFSK